MPSAWGEGLARLVVASAVSGDLITRFPGAFSPDLFNPSSGAPRWRIASIIADYVKTYSTRPPVEFVSDAVAAESDAVQEEWQAVQMTDLPEDPAYIYDQVRGAIEYRRLEQALLDAGKVLEARGVEGIVDARDALDKAEPLLRGDDRSRVLRFEGDSEERLDMWATGDDIMGERIPTGLPALDNVLGGGPTRRETWYMLAPPKGAKTMSLIRIARGASLRGFGVYLTTFEMQAIRMLLRADRMASKMTKAELQADQSRLRAVFEGMRTAGSGEIYVQEQPTQRKGSVQAVARSVEKIRRAGGKIDLVVFDYLNIMGSKVNDKEKRHELAAISREMSDLAKDLDVLVWSAALVNRKAIEKEAIKKQDIAEAFEVIAVCDGTVSICAPPGLVRNNARRLYVAAAREEADEVMAGDYAVDFPRMQITPMDSVQAERWIVEGRPARGRRRAPEEEAA